VSGGVTRRGRIVLATLIAAVCFAGCGGGDSTSSSPATTVAEAPTGTPTTTAVAPGGSRGDRAAAERAVLRQDDLPGWTAKPHEEQPDDPDVEGQLAACMGVEPAMLKTDNASTVHSPDFESPRSGNFEAQNSVSLLETAALATERLAVLQRSETAGCLSTAMSEIMTRTIQNPRSGNAPPPGLTVGQVSSQVTPFPVLGDGTVAFAVEIPLEAEGQQTTIYGELVFAVKGRAATQFTLLGYGEPFPAEEAERLATTVVDRLPAS
jgi:hypothetical protein